MPIVWRLARSEFADELDGEGARLFGGRWNSRGRTALYTSTHLSLSVLEVYVHIPPALRDNLPVLQAVQISIPADASTTRIPPERLRELMTSTDPMAACRAVGDHWIDRGEELILEVPSILVVEETNLILNPAHIGMKDVAIVSARAFHFDSRLAATKP
jgi:RES domain-containing protein